MKHISTTKLILISTICFVALVFLVILFPIVGTILAWIYALGLVFMAFFISWYLWLVASGRIDTKTMIFVTSQLAEITGDVNSTRMAVTFILAIVNVLLLWPLELMINKWRTVHSSVAASELRTKSGQASTYPMLAFKNLIVLLITALFFVFDAPTYAIVICGVSAILWLITQSISTTTLLKQLKKSAGPVYMRLWVIAATHVAILVLFFAFFARGDDPSLNLVNLLRVTFVELIVSPMGFIEAIANTSITPMELLKNGTGILMYSTLIILLFQKSNIARSDDDWIALASGQLTANRPEKALKALANVKNKGSQELQLRATVYLMLGRFDEAVELIGIRRTVLGYNKEEEYSQYGEAGGFLIEAENDVDLFRKFIRYWFSKEQPKDVILASVVMAFAMIMNQSESDIVELLPDGKYPLTRAMLHSSFRNVPGFEFDIDSVMATLNMDYDDASDSTFRDLLTVSLLIDGKLTTDESPDKWLDDVIKNIPAFTSQQCIIFYGQMIALVTMVENKPSLSGLKARMLELKDNLMGGIDPEVAEKLRAQEGQIGKHFRVLSQKITD